MIRSDVSSASRTFGSPRAKSLALYLLGVIFLAAGLAQAQDQKPPEQKPVDQNAKDQTGQDQEQGQTYEGPSILSRDKSLIGQRGGRLIDFRLYGEMTGIYDSGLTPVATDPQGNLLNIGGNYGVEAGFGVIGSRRWRRDKIALEYHGAYRHYQNAAYFDGVDQFLNLGYSHSLKRRLYLDLKETVGTSSLANGAFTYLPLTNTDLFAVPANELFDNRTSYLQSRVDLTWQKSARLSFGIGGEGFVVRRRSLALAGLNGYNTRANVAYRLTRRQTISASYSYGYFDFQRAFGNSNIQTVVLGYSAGLSRRWDFALQAGGSRVESLGLTLVSIDPAVAAIVGRGVAVVTFFRQVHIPNAEARLIRRFDRSALTLNYSTGATPGNGVYLTSRQNVGSASYSYAGYRRLTAGFTASYSELSTLGQSLGKYTNVQGGAGFTYKLVRDTHMEVRYDYRRYTTENAFYKKDSQRISVGFAFSPGETPIAIW